MLEGSFVTRTVRLKRLIFTAAIFALPRCSFSTVGSPGRRFNANLFLRVNYATLIFAQLRSLSYNQVWSPNFRFPIFPRTRFKLLFMPFPSVLLASSLFFSSSFLHLKKDFSRSFLRKFQDSPKIYWIGQLVDRLTNFFPSPLPPPPFSFYHGRNFANFPCRINPYVRIMKLLLSRSCPGKKSKVLWRFLA